MFDLDREIESWRAQWLENESVAASDVDELESHLRDSIAELSRRANELTEEELFAVAARRVGSPEVVALEFSKINGARTWIRRAQWMLAGYLLLSFAFRIMYSTGSALTFLAVYFHVPLWAAFSVSGFGLCLCIAMLSMWIRGLTSGRTLGTQQLAVQFSSMARSGRQGWLVLAVVGIVTLFGGINAGSSIVFSRLLAADELAVASLILSSSHWIANLVLMATVVVLLCWLVAIDGRDTRDRWSPSKVVMATLMMTLIVSCAFGLMSFGVEPLFGPQWAGVLER